MEIRGILSRGILLCSRCAFDTNYVMFTNMKRIMLQWTLPTATLHGQILQCGFLMGIKRTGNDSSDGIAAQTILEEPCENRVSVRDVDDARRSTRTDDRPSRCRRVPLLGCIVHVSRTVHAVHTVHTARQLGPIGCMYNTKGVNNAKV